VEVRLRELSAQGDPLEKLAGVVDSEIFRAEPVAGMGPRDRSRGGRPPVDPVLKLRMLVLQAMHGLSLAQTGCPLCDRPSRMRLGGARPRRRRAGREHLVGRTRGPDRRRRARRADRPSRPGDHLGDHLPMAEPIVDATLVAAPRQRNTDGEKARIEAGETAAEIRRETPPSAREG